MPGPRTSSKVAYEANGQSMVTGHGIGHALAGVCLQTETSRLYHIQDGKHVCFNPLHEAIEWANIEPIIPAANDPDARVISPKA